MPQSNFYEPALESLEATTTEPTFFNHWGPTAWSLCSVTRRRRKEQPAHLNKQRIPHDQEDPAQKK